LKVDGYMLRGVWQALNCLSIHATYCVIIAGASPGETKMWAAVRENDYFLRPQGKQNKQKMKAGVRKNGDFTARCYA